MIKCHDSCFSPQRNSAPQAHTQHIETSKAISHTQVILLRSKWPSIKTIPKFYLQRKINTKRLNLKIMETKGVNEEFSSSDLYKNCNKKISQSNKETRITVYKTVLKRFQQQQQKLNHQYRKPSLHRIRCWHNTIFTTNQQSKLNVFQTYCSKQSGDWYLSENNNHKMFQSHPRRRKVYLKRVVRHQGQSQMRMLAKMPSFSDNFSLHFIDFPVEKNKFIMNSVENWDRTTMWHI